MSPKSNHNATITMTEDEVRVMIREAVWPIKLMMGALVTVSVAAFAGGIPWAMAVQSSLATVSANSGSAKAERERLTKAIERLEDRINGGAK